MQMVDARSRLEIPLFDPNYSSRSGHHKVDGRSSDHHHHHHHHHHTHRSSSSSHHSTQRVSGRFSDEKPMKSCLRNSGRKSEAEMENRGHSKDIETGKATHHDDSRSTARVESQRTPSGDPAKRRTSTKKWIQSKVEHVDNCDYTESCDGKRKTRSSIRFQYQSNLHYGSLLPTKSRAFTSLPARFRSLSFYSSLPRRQPRVEPEKPGKTESKQRPRGSTRRNVTSPETKTNYDHSPSVDRKLNGTYHMYHEDDTNPRRIDGEKEGGGDPEILLVEDFVDEDESADNKKVSSDDDDGKTLKRPNKNGKKIGSMKEEEKEEVDEYVIDFDDDTVSIKSEEQ